MENEGTLIYCICRIQLLAPFHQIVDLNQVRWHLYIPCKLHFGHNIMDISQLWNFKIKCIKCFLRLTLFFLESAWASSLYLHVTCISSVFSSSHNNWKILNAFCSQNNWQFGFLYVSAKLFQIQILVNAAYFQICFF